MIVIASNKPLRDSVPTLGEVRSLLKQKPRYVFFVYWSQIVPPDVLEQAECVGFHMTDLPYGRGGTPLQNLIVRGHKDTMLTAFRMTSEVDAGPVYLKRALSLKGSAQEIYGRAAALALDMIDYIIATNLTPAPQTGEPVMFERRTPAQSVMPDDYDAVYDHIRMLDADGYPHAFLDHGTMRYTFSDAHPADGAINARVRITRRQDAKQDSQTTQVYERSRA